MEGFWRREDKWIEAVESQQRKGRKEDKTRHLRVCIFGHIKKRPLQPQRYMQIVCREQPFFELEPTHVSNKPKC
jgi:hypothetical protein